MQDLTEGPWRQSNLDAGASRVIAVPEPLGGALVVGESVIAYMSQGQAMKCTPIKPTIIRVRCCFTSAHRSGPALRTTRN